jgi:hypothetical protein
MSGTWNPVRPSRGLGLCAFGTQAALALSRSDAPTANMPKGKDSYSPQRGPIMKRRGRCSVVPWSRLATF